MPTVNTSDKTSLAAGIESSSSWTLETSNTDKVKIVLKRKFPMSSSNQTECLDRDRIPSQSSCINGSGYDEGSLFENIKRWRATQNSDSGPPARYTSSDGVPSSQQPSPRDSGIDVGSPSRRDADGPGDGSVPDANGRSTVMRSKDLTTIETEEDDDCVVIDSSSDDAGIACEDVGPVNAVVSPRCLFTLPGGAKRFLSTRHGEECFQLPPPNHEILSPQCVSISSSRTSFINQQFIGDRGLFVGASSSEASLFSQPPRYGRGSTTVSRSSSEMSCLDEPPVCGAGGNDSSTSSDTKNECRTERNIFEFLPPVPDKLVAGIMSSLSNKTSTVETHRPIGFARNWKSKLKLNYASANVPSIDASTANQKRSGLGKVENKPVDSFATGAAITSSTGFPIDNLLSRRSSSNVAGEIKPRKEDYVSEYAQFLLLNKIRKRPKKLPNMSKLQITDIVDNDDAVHKCKSKNVKLQKNHASRPAIDETTGQSSSRFGNVQKIFPPSSECELPVLLTEIDKNQSHIGNARGSSNKFQTVCNVPPSPTECELPIMLSKISKTERTDSLKTIKSVEISHKYSKNRRLNAENDSHAQSSGIISNDRSPISMKSLPYSLATTDVARPNVRSLTSQRLSSSFYNKTSDDSETAVFSSLTKCMKRTSIDHDGLTTTGTGVKLEPGSNLIPKMTLSLKPAVVESKKCDPVHYGKQAFEESMELETVDEVCKPSLNRNVKRSTVDRDKLNSTHLKTSSRCENVKLTSTRNAIQLSSSKIAKGSKFGRTRSLQPSFHKSRIDRQTNDKYRASRDRQETFLKRKRNSYEVEPIRKTSRTLRPNSRYVNDFALNDDSNDKTDRKELTVINESPPKKTNSTRRRNLRNNIAPIDIDVTVRQYELLDRLRLRTLQVIERLLPMYSVYPAVMPNEHSPAVGRLLDEIIDVLSDVEPTRGRSDNLIVQLQPRVSLCRYPLQCTTNFRRRFVRLLQLLLPDIDDFVDDISAEEVDRLADAVIAANDDDTPCLY